MNRLPAVLQKEIWEYVRGDRSHWKTQYNQVINHLLASIDRAEAGLYLYDIPSTKSHLILEYHGTVFVHFTDVFIKVKNRGYLAFARSLGHSMFVDSQFDWNELYSAWHKYEQTFLS